MKYTKLGNSDLTVSRICMGCMGFGDAENGQHSWTVDEAATREIVKHGLDCGINFLTQPSAIRAGRASDTSAVRCAISQNATRLSSRQNFSHARRRRSRPA